jgi:sulfhydrogenase subunit delta
LLGFLTALLAGRRPDLPTHSVCFECKSRGTTCVLVQGTPCLGPVTQAGCGALCPAYGRGCYGCFGPMAAPNPDSLIGKLRATGMSDRDIDRVFHTFNTNAPEFLTVGVPHHRESP